MRPLGTALTYATWQFASLELEYKTQIGNKSFLARRLANAHPDRIQRVLLRVFIGCDVFALVCVRSS